MLKIDKNLIDIELNSLHLIKKLDIRINEKNLKKIKVSLVLKWNLKKFFSRSLEYFRGEKFLNNYCEYFNVLNEKPRNNRKDFFNSIKNLNIKISAEDCFYILIKKNFMKVINKKEWIDFFSIYEQVLFNSEKENYGNKFEKLDKIAENGLSNIDISYYIKKINKEIKKIDSDFFLYVNSLEKNGFLQWGSSTNLCSFCANLPLSKLTFVYLERDYTTNDIFNYLHELGHVYHFYNLSKNNVKFTNNIICEFYALSFEIFLVEAIRSDVLHEIFIKKLISDTIYWLTFVRFIYLTNIGESDANEFLNFLYSFYKDFIGIEEKEILDIFFNNFGFIFEYNNYIDYLIALIMSIYFLSNKDFSFSKLKHTMTNFEETNKIFKDLVHDIKVSDILCFSKKFFIRKLKI